MKLELDILKIVNKHRKTQGALISILLDIQIQYGYLPAQTLRIIAERMNRPLVDVYAIATFYKMFRFEPRGKHLIKVCTGTSCYIHRSAKLIEELRRQLQIEVGETTADNEFTFETSHCMNACAIGPSLIVDGIHFSNVKPSQVEGILEKIENGYYSSDNVSIGQLFTVDVNCPICDHSLMDSEYHIDGYPSVKMTMVFEQRRGWIRFSCLYSSHNIESEYPVHVDTTVHLYCPHCNSELRSDALCYECESMMIPLKVAGGAHLQFCSRRGCTVHFLDVEPILN